MIVPLITMPCFIILSEYNNNYNWGCIIHLGVHFAFLVYTAFLGGGGGGITMPCFIILSEYNNIIVYP